MKKFVCLIALLTLFTSCKKELSNQQPASPKLHSNARDVIVNAEGETLLGPQLNNPYTPENMTAALRELEQKGVGVPKGFSIETTHYYVKYMPQSWEQYVQLHMDTSHSYFDYPLDREIVTGGNRYHDPQIVDSMPEYQYTAIEKGVPLDNDIPYEVISSLYIPEQDKRIANTDFAEQLLDQAYARTGNYQELPKSPQERRSAYRPAGKILIHDNRLNQDIGLEGVLVTARRWFTVFKGRTDKSGDFLVNGNFLRDCNYSAHFESWGFNVRQNLINIIAYVNGPKQSGNWNTTINGGYNNFAGDVFRGAYYYHYKFIDGLLRPFNPTGKFTSYIAKSGSGSAQGVNWGIIPVIKIWQQSSYGYTYMDDEVFSTTIHETAHFTHNKLLGLNTIAYASVQAEIRESWAVAVEWWLTGLEYKSRGISNYGDPNYSPFTPPGYPNQYAYQYWNLGVNNNADKYTSLFINCMDYYNEIGHVFSGPYPAGTVDDRIGQLHPGYKGAWTISELEGKVIRWSVNLATTTTKLKASEPANVTDDDVDLLMSFY